MAGNKITGAEIVNKISYQTDIASLRRTRKQIKDLQRKFNESYDKEHKDALKRTRLEAAEQIREARRVAREQRRLGANRSGAGAGGNRGGSGRSGGRSEADREARQRREQERQQNKQRREEEKRIREHGTRNERADLMRRSRGFDITRMQGLNAEQRHNAVREAHRISEEYRNQTMSLQQANEALRQQRRQLESIARQQRQANRRAGVPQPRHSRLAAGLAATGVIGGIGYGAERLAGSARESIAGSIERNSGRQQLQAYNISSLEADALIQLVRQTQGKTITYENLSDNAKDFRERIGEMSANGQWKQAKDKSWSFSGGGEMGDLLTAVAGKGGIGAAQQVQQNLKGMNFIEYIGYLRDLQKQFKFSEQEISFFAENINDASVLLSSLDSSGKNLDDTMMSIARTGGAITDQQRDNLNYLANLGAVAESASNNLGDAFSSSFAESMRNAGIGADETRQSFAELRPIMRELGETVGGITAWISKHLGMIPGSASYNKEQYQEGYNTALKHKDDGIASRWLHERWESQSTAGEAGWNDAIAGKKMNPDYIGGGADAGNNPTAFSAIQSGQDSFYQPNPFSMRLPPINQNLTTDVHIHVDGAELSSIFSAVADSRFENGMSDLTFDVNNMTFNN